MTYYLHKNQSDMKYQIMTFLITIYDQIEETSRMQVQGTFLIMTRQKETMTDLQFITANAVGVAYSTIMKEMDSKYKLANSLPCLTILGI